MRAKISMITAAAVLLLSVPAIASDGVEAVVDQLVSAVRSGDEASAEYTTCFQIQADRHNARLLLLGMAAPVDARSVYHSRLAKQLAPLTQSENQLSVEHGDIAGTDGDESLGNGGASHQVVLAGNIAVTGNRGSLDIPAVQLASGRWCLLAANL